MGMAQMLRGQKIRLVPPQDRSPLGSRADSREEAKKRGIRYSSWGRIAPNWWANAGISRPYMQFIIGEPYHTYGQMLSFYKKGDMQAIFGLEDAILSSTRAYIKGLFGSDGTVAFDANGSCLISTLSKGVKHGGRGLEAITFSDQGRLVYAALGFEARSIIEFRQNFEQQLGIFDHPYPEAKLPADEGMRPSVHVVDIFKEGRVPKSDGELLADFESALKGNRRAGMVLLLHVSRTGRVLPVEEMARMARGLLGDAMIFVDGCQAVGRVPSEEMRKAYEACDGYVLVGHKALGAMITSAAILKKGMEAKLKGALKSGLLAYPKLFQFESESMNAAVLANSPRSGFHYMVSAPEIASLRVALEASERDFARNSEIVRKARAGLVEFFGSFQNVRLLFGDSRYVPDIVPFVFEPQNLAKEIKEMLARSEPAITVSPITQIDAMRVAIDPKLPDFDGALAMLKGKFSEAMAQF